MSEPTFEVILVGPYFCDLIFTGLPELPQLGAEVFGTGVQLGPGGNFNTAYSLHRLGLKTGWVCDFGVDFFSNLILDKIRQIGMNTSLFRQHNHNVCAVSAAFSFREDRGFISYVDPYKPGDIIEVLETKRPRCLLVGGNCLGEEFKTIAAVAHRLGCLVAMDWQHCERNLQTPGVIEMLAQIDIFLPNLREVKKLASSDGVVEADAAEAIEKIAGYTRLLVVKQGPQGALAVSRKEKVFVPGIKVDRVVDTTGAGDCFNAGFIYGFLRGQSLDTCLKYANLCGGLSVTGYGVSQAPSGAQVEGLLDHYEALVAGAPHLIPKQPQIGFISGT